MLAELAHIIITAALSALATWALAYAYFRVRLAKELDELEARIGGEVEERVYQAAIKAGQELLPEFRQEVANGFKDAMLSAARGDVVEQAAKSMAERGAEVVGSRLGNLLGPRKPRP